MATVPSGTVYLGNAGFRVIPLTGRWNRPFRVLRNFEGEPPPEVTYDDTFSQTGTKSLKYTWANGVDGDNNTDPGGGIFDYVNRAFRGETVVFEINAYYEEGYLWTSSDLGQLATTKFMRISTKNPNFPFDSEEYNSGFNDIYTREDGHDTWFFIYEGEQVRDYTIPDGAALPHGGGWFKFKMVVTLDTVPLSQGGEAQVLFYKDGVLLGNMVDRYTLKAEEGFAENPHYNTYWNGVTPQEQTCWIDNVEWSNMYRINNDGPEPVVESILND